MKGSVILITTEFTFDGTASSTKNLYIVNTGNGIKPLPFLPARNIIEEQTPNNDVPYFYRTQKTPLSFTLDLTLIGEDWTLAKKKEIAEWLFKGEYKQFTTADYTGYTFYVMAVNRADFLTTNFDEGYFTIEFRMNAPHAYTTAGTTDARDLTTNPTYTDIVVDCGANVNEYFYPIIEIELQGAETDVSIVNQTDDDREFAFTGLTTGETVYIDNSKKHIISDTGNPKYNEFNGNWFRMKYGNNTLRVTGSCIITFYTQYPVLV